MAGIHHGCRRTDADRRARCPRCDSTFGRPTRASRSSARSEFAGLDRGLLLPGGVNGRETATVSILHRRRLIARSSGSRDYSSRGSDRMFPRSAAASCREQCFRASRPASRRTHQPNASAGRNRADMVLLHRLPQTCGLLLERCRPRHIVVHRSKETLRTPLRIVDGAAARPLADKLARDGTTGRLPAIMRAPPICWRVAAIAVTWPAPKRPAFTVDMTTENVSRYECSRCSRSAFRRAAARIRRSDCIRHGSRPRRSARDIHPTTDGNNHTARSGASRSRPNRRNQIRNQSRRPIHRTKRKPATRTDGRNRRHKPDQATTPTHSPYGNQRP